MAPTDGGGRFRLRLWPTLIAAPALAVLIGLGTWQVERLHWKEDLNATLAARLAAPAVVPEALPADPAATEFRKVRLEGRFRHDRELYLGPRTLRGEVGVHVVTPFQRTAGGTVLVDRGFVPAARKDPATRAEGQVAGVVTMEGVLRLPGRRGPFTPDDDPRANQWFVVDPPAMAAAAGIGGVAPWYVDAGPAPNPGGLPVGGQTVVMLPNNHLQYAVTWYGLAAALAVIYVLSSRRPATPAKP
ncbi:MAG: SURF1 family protein [Rhodospirillales bacterium]